MAIIDKNDVEMGWGYYDEYGRWRKTKHCFVYCGADRCNCGPPNGEWKRELTNKNVLDPFTFGDSPAAVTLAAILNEINEEKVTQKVSGFVVRYHQLIKHAQDIKDPTTRAIVGHMFIEKINQSTLQIPDKAKSFMKNAVIGRIKDKLIRL
jgi:hypothetical protein